jgi:hypothetical protein
MHRTVLVLLAWLVVGSLAALSLTQAEAQPGSLVLTLLTLLGVFSVGLRR